MSEFRINLKKITHIRTPICLKNLTANLKVSKALRSRGMTILAVEIDVPCAESVVVTGDTLSVDLNDGRTISVPLAWFPRLVHSTPDERNNWSLIGRGYGIHWEDIDEDISVANLLAGKPSGESQASFKNWLSQRA